MGASDLSTPLRPAVAAHPWAHGHPAIAIWLFICCGAVAAMVLIGGITRLTDSGLSIAEWRPLMGALPPLSDAEWDRVFALYRDTSEYRLQNAGMTLAGFKTIFWWEYLHRLWGRLIGVIFIVPFAWFALRGLLDRGLGLRLLGIFALGGLQGLIGWWMVASGLVDRVDVSPYRLAVHLGVAFLIYALLFWTALDLVAPRQQAAAPERLRRFAWVALAMVSVTVMAGALVAGTKAGLIYNSFPLMGGQLVPPDYAALQPFFLNLFENPAAVQFNHRLVAISTVVFLGAFWWTARRDPTFVRPAAVMFALACAQALIGIWTLLLVVPLPLGVAHQAGALALLTAALWTARRAKAPA